MARVNNTIRTGTSTVYGPRETGGQIGVFETDGALNELVFDLTGRSLSDAVFSPTYLPANAVVIKAYMEVKEAFNLQGSSVLKIGTSSTEATNGLSITEAQLEAAAPSYVDLTSTLAGTWDNEVPLAAKALVKAVFSAGGLTSGAAVVGRAKIVIQYVKLQ